MIEETNAGGNEGGGEETVETPAWMNSAPDAYKQNETFAKFGEAADFYAKADELMKAEGDTLKIPGEDATDEEKSAFAQKMGRPETVEGYEIAKPTDWPEGIGYDENLDAAFKGWAFELGLPADTAKGLHERYNSAMLDAHNKIAEAEKAAIEKADNKLKDEWKGDDYKVNTEIAHRAFKEFGDDEAAAFLDETMIGDISLGEHPVFRRIFANIGKATGDDNANSGSSGLGGELSPEQAAEKRFPNTKF